MGLSFAWCAKRGVFNHRDTEDSTIIYIDHFDGPVTDSRPRAEMAYNPSTALRAGSAGERVSKKSPDWDVRYIMAQGQIMAVYENIGGTWTHKQNFIFGNGRRLAMWNASNSSPYYYYADYLGSVREFARQNQSYVYRRDYYPFGQDRNATGVLDNPEHFKWVAKEEDEETGLYYFGARYYDPELGRWTQVDPLWQEYPGLSPYIYVADNPLIYIDPTGEFFVLDSWLFGFASKLFTEGFSAAVSEGNLRAANDIGIWKGLFTSDESRSLGGRVWQVTSRFTWELPQTALGFTGAQLQNLTGGVQSVSHGYGATLIETRAENWGGVTFGSYIFARRYTEIGDHLFRHEYGHYIQSQLLGPGYLPIIGIPSLASAAINPYGHHNYWTERWADYLSSRYRW